MITRRGILVVAWLAGSCGAASKGQLEVHRGAPPPHVRQRIDAMERVIESRNDESINSFVHEQLSPELRASKSPDEWLSSLREIRALYQGFGTVKVRPDGDSRIVHFGECRGENRPLHLEFESAPPHLLKAIRVGEPQAAADRPPAPAEPQNSPLTWDKLRDRLKEEETAGFSGSVLVDRDGKVFLHEGYGLCNREKNIPCKPDSVFAIGSVPIDFTKAAILTLGNMGELKLSSLVSEFFPGAPQDKKSITIQQLMTGRSGLRNFHGRPTDVDLDHAWIDRDTAVKRILEDDLLFAPGTDRAHSHSAFGLLAAIIEIASEQSYSSFLEKYLFRRCAMTRTALYEDAKFPEEEMAVGYGGVPYGDVNSPSHWGRTSWLVLGSGGMVSTTGDLYRWISGIRSGKILTEHQWPDYWSPPGSILEGGSENGFVAYYTEGPGSLMILLSNSGLGNERTRRLAHDLAALVNKPRYRLGVSIAFSHEAITIQDVQQGTPAHTAGLRSGDVILAANGQPLDPHEGQGPLMDLIRAGETLKLKVRHEDGTEQELSIKPRLPE